MTPEELRQFAAAAQRYCAWVESQPSEPREDLLTALTLVAGVYASSIGLPAALEKPPEEYGRVFVEDRDRDHAARRFAALPVQRYTYSIVPLIPSQPLVVGVLPEDLFDVYLGLKRGLLHYAIGQHEAATWDWAFGRWSWGGDAAKAIYVMHCFLFGEPPMRGLTTA